MTRGLRVCAVGWRCGMVAAVGMGAAALMVGCGSSAPNCAETTVLSVTPLTATANSASAAPANQVQFEAVARPALVDPKAECALPQNVALVQATWTSAVPAEVSVSSANGATNGLALYKTPTNGAVTLTASYGSGTAAQTATAQLTCH